jgi:hypothetical protein
MMTQMAPMLETMKAKMGKRRFATMMQTIGPMMGRMMEGGGGGLGRGLGGLGGLMGGGVPSGGYGGYGGNVSPESFGGGNIMGMLGGAGGGELMSMIPQLMRMANFGGGRHGRRDRHR